jgi:thioredoxin-related protein
MNPRAPAVMRLLRPLLCAAAVFVLAGGARLAAAEPDAGSIEFDDTPLTEPLEHPEWFKQGFLDLPQDLADARAAGKRGLILYFGQARCAYCKMLLQHALALPDVQAYARAHFDVVPIDIWGLQEVTDIDGRVVTERDFAVREGLNFTPSLVFYDAQGRMALRLRGYYPPYKLRAALEFVADGHHLREGFPAYLARGDSGLRFEPGDLVEEPFFLAPPHVLDRSRMPGERPLLVVFEQGDCHACDVLHTQSLRDAAIRRLLEQFDAVQLDVRSDTPVVTPDGRRTTARQWAQDLGLIYTPSLVFYDEDGWEIMRVDSVVRFFRLRNVMQYVLAKGYLEEPNYQRWRMVGGQ